MKTQKLQIQFLAIVGIVKNFALSFILWCIFLTTMCCFGQKKFNDSIVKKDMVHIYYGSLKTDRGLFVGDSLLFYVDDKGKLFINPILLCDCKKHNKNKKSK